MGSFRLNKKGDLKYSIVIVALVCLAVLVIVYFWLSGSDSDTAWAACKQSILLRQSIPDFTEATSMPVSDIKTIPPLNCEPQVIKIDFKDTTRAEQVVADTMLRCWDLVGLGKYDHIYSNAFFESDVNSNCFVCAIVSLDSKTFDYYSRNPIMISRALSRKVDVNGDVKPYLNFFNLFSGTGGTFKWNSEGEFKISKTVTNSHLLQVDEVDLNVEYPEKINPYKGNGDLFITISYVLGQKNWFTRDYPSNMGLLFYQPTPASMSQLTNNPIIPHKFPNDAGKRVNVCDQFENF